MKRYALAGTFAMLGGLATLILVAGIFYSCRQGGTPHRTPYNSDTETHSGSSSHSNSSLVPASKTVVDARSASAVRLTFERA